MIPKKVGLTNFLSFGEGELTETGERTPGAEIRFDESETLWVLSGPNGIGKSSVFDAMTYALFGEHRGSGRKEKDKDKQLIRHGANGFRIEFEFEYAGHDYRILRSVGKKAIERVFRKEDAEWKEVPIPSGRNKVNEWAEQQLGLNYDQFCASVLLKQGEADRIITGTGRDRLEMLKRIIGLERYESLSSRVHDISQKAKTKWTMLRDELDQFPRVPPEELDAANDTLKAAEERLNQTRIADSQALARVGQAKEFARLEHDRRRLEQLLQDADERRAAAATIRDSHTRLTDLDAVVPTLKTLIAAREELATLVPERDRLRTRDEELTASVSTATHSRDAAKTAADQHRRDADAAALGRREKQYALDAAKDQFQVSGEVEEIDRQLADLPPDLDELLKSSETECRVIDYDAARAADLCSSTRAVFKDREQQLQDFDRVEVGVKCSRCRQPIGPDHVETERRDLTTEVERLRQELTEAEASESRIAERRRDLRAKHDLCIHQRGIREKLRDRRVTRLRHKELVPSSEVRSRMDQLQAELDALDTSVAQERQKADVADKQAKEHEAHRVAAERERKSVQESRTATERRFTAAETKVHTLAATLRGEWATRWESFTPNAVGELDRELRSLKDAGTTQRFLELQNDEGLRGEWDRQLDELRKSLEAIPLDARVPEAEANAALTVAKRTTADAADACDAARRFRQGLVDQQTRRDELQANERTAETTHRLHEKLDRALGADGLLRDLVRTAERQIVRFADETVRRLSDGDLSIELDDAEEGPDKAFTLKVRRQDDPTPIGVSYLSGSQKFRVAVAVALAIGRFATTGTQARPLESVIIDEGFGSLDRDGLRAMADELKLLRDKSDLKRIILVSHQEEFVSSFPVGWRLRRGDTGTTAEPFRR